MISSKEVTISNSWARRFQTQSTTLWKQRNPRNISFSINKFYLYNNHFKINVNTIALRKRNSYLYGRALLRLRVEFLSSTGYRERHRQEQRTTYIHSLCRTSNICLRHTITVYKDCRKCRVLRRLAFSFFFLLPITQKWEGNGKG